MDFHPFWGLGLPIGETPRHSALFQGATPVAQRETPDTPALFPGLQAPLVADTVTLFAGRERPNKKAAGTRPAERRTTRPVSTRHPESALPDGEPERMHLDSKEPNRYKAPTGSRISKKRRDSESEKRKAEAFVSRFFRETNHHRSHSPHDLSDRRPLLEPSPILPAKQTFAKETPDLRIDARHSPMPGRKSLTQAALLPSSPPVASMLSPMARFMNQEDSYEPLPESFIPPSGYFDPETMAHLPQAVDAAANDVPMGERGEPEGDFQLFGDFADDEGSQHGLNSPVAFPSLFSVQPDAHGDSHGIDSLVDDLANLSKLDAEEPKLFERSAAPSPRL